MPKEIITIREAAKRLEVNPQTVRRAILSGKLQAAWGGLMKNRIKGVYVESVDAILKSANRGAK